MKERPILFSGAMVRAILSGQKTVTRRAIKVHDHYGLNAFVGMDGDIARFSAMDDTRTFTVALRCPYGQPSDRLWVRETWARVGTCDPGYLTYRATYPDCLPPGLENVPADLHEIGERWKPSIHMPRSASRILLEITAVRVERLQDISEQQALAEGVRSCEHELDPHGNDYSPYELFSALWVSINGHDSWHATPWVWVVEFKQVKP